MDWSKQQLAALEAVRAWREDPSRQVFRLFGYAGTGKSTLAKTFAGPGVLYGAFTGKAAYVLQKKGMPARTLHNLIYRPSSRSAARLQELVGQLEEERKKEQPDAAVVALLENEITKEETQVRRPAFTLNVDSDVRFCRMLVVDEVSMVGEEMGRDLLSFGKKVLVLGDPGQLPPVASAGFFTEATPDVLLTEIHRQAEDSPIIDLATTVRHGGTLTPGKYGESRVVKKGEIALEHIVDYHDQILCGRNATRRTVNSRVRRHLFGDKVSPFPVEGDRLVCLKNNHELNLLNGGLWEVLVCNDISDSTLLLKLKNDDDETEQDVLAHKAPFLGQDVPYFQLRDAEQFDYGYCLTVHKAQGSQWESVYIVNEADTFREDANRWLYTGITRAARRVSISL